MLGHIYSSLMSAIARERSAIADLIYSSLFGFLENWNVNLHVINLGILTGFPVVNPRFPV